MQTAGGNADCRAKCSTTSCSIKASNHVVNVIYIDDHNLVGLEPSVGLGSQAKSQRRQAVILQLQSVYEAGTPRPENADRRLAFCSHSSSSFTV